VKILDKFFKHNRDIFLKLLDPTPPLTIEKKGNVYLFIPSKPGSSSKNQLLKYGNAMEQSTEFMRKSKEKEEEKE